MSDRAVQDEIIGYLADAGLRTLGPPAISAGEADKATRFAHFLARRYFRDRLARSFRYSHRLRGQTGRIAAEVVDCEGFDRFLGQCVMGSLKSAQQVAQMARAHLDAVPEPGPWWQDLLDYECAYFLQAATAEPGPVSDWPSKGVSAICRRFAWALPEMLPLLRAGNAIRDDLRREVMLLFCRTDSGRIYVVEIDTTLESVFQTVDGTRTVEEIAARASTNLQAAQQALETLANIGAVRVK